MMTWNDLYMMIHEKGLADQNFLHENVTIYDSFYGEYYPADAIEFTEADDIIDAGNVFLTISPPASWIC